MQLDLVTGKTYKVVFWAQADVAPYTYAEDTQNITVTYSGAANDESRDAFYFTTEPFKVTGPTTKSVTLKRPFAQLNVLTSDFEAATTAGINLTKTGLKLMLPKTISLADGTVGPEEEVEYTLADIPGDEIVKGEKTYKYLSMNYILAPADKTTVDVKLTTDFALNNELSFTAVPVQRNYRTNIFCALLTDPTIFDVEIDPEFENEYNNGALKNAVMQKNDDGTVTCVTPALPAGVTAADLTGKAGVIVKADGTTEIFEATTGREISDKMAEATELYFAPNVAISTGSHHLVVPQSGITIHGNGATISGGEQDFSINGTYETGSTITLNLSDLNGVKVWGEPKNGITYNINMKGCSVKGTDNKNGKNLIMVRGADANVSTVNMTIEDCHVEGVQVAVHTSHPGNITMTNCSFKNVGIPMNLAKKQTNESVIKVSGCTFDQCGILPTDTDNSAYSYAAPVRIVDNGGAANSMKVTVDKCTFNGTLSDWDILLMDYRAGKTWYAVDYTITDCTPAAPKVKAE